MSDSAFPGYSEHSKAKSKYYLQMQIQYRQLLREDFTILSPADAVNEPWVGTRDYSCNIYTNDKETFPEAYWGSIFISSAVDPYKPELDIKL